MTVGVEGLVASLDYNLIYSKLPIKQSLNTQPLDAIPDSYSFFKHRVILTRIHVVRVWTHQGIPFQCCSGILQKIL